MIFRRAFIVAIAAAGLLPAVAPAETPVEKAAAAVKRGEYSQAEDLLTPLVEHRQADAAALFYMTVIRLAQRQSEDALKFAERAVKADSTKPEYFCELGAACLARIADVGPLEGNDIAIKMRKAYEKALGIDARYQPALLGLVYYYEHAPEIAGGDLKKAREYAERVRQLNPYQGELELGRLAAGAKNMEEALAHYDAAAKANPEDLGTATASGWVLFKLGRKEEARARFEAVLKIDPQFEPAKMGLAQTAPPAH